LCIDLRGHGERIVRKFFGTDFCLSRRVSSPEIGVMLAIKSQNNRLYAYQWISDFCLAHLCDFSTLPRGPARDCTSKLIRRHLLAGVGIPYRASTCSPQLVEVVFCYRSDSVSTVTSTLIKHSAPRLVLLWATQPKHYMARPEGRQANTLFACRGVRQTGAATDATTEVPPDAAPTLPYRPPPLYFCLQPTIFLSSAAHRLIN